MTLVIAHRGASARAPANTLAAARLAHALGADGWELDVQPTRDGAFVVMHDFTLECSTDAAERYPERAPWRVADFELAELRRLRVGGEPIPTLEETLDLSRELDWFANVELKAPPGLDARELGHRLARQLPAGPRMHLSSFDFQGLAGAREASPDLSLGLLTGDPVEDPLALLREWPAGAWHPRLTSTDGEQVREVLRAGHRVFVWTVNDEAAIRRALDWGVTGIITDQPDRLVKLVRGGEAR